MKYDLMYIAGYKINDNNTYHVLCHMKLCGNEITYIETRLWRAMKYIIIHVFSAIYLE